MDGGLEERIVFNPGFGAAALWSYAHGYFRGCAESEGPDLPLMQIALPLSYHRKTAKSLGRISFSGGILRAISRVPDLSCRLTERADDLATTTWQSLALACASGMLKVVHDTDGWPRYFPRLKNLPREFVPEDESLRAIISTADRLGYWLANEQRSAIWNYLNMRF